MTRAELYWFCHFSFSLLRWELHSQFIVTWHRLFTRTSSEGIMFSRFYVSNTSNSNSNFWRGGNHLWLSGGAKTATKGINVQPSVCHPVSERDNFRKTIPTLMGLFFRFFYHNTNLKLDGEQNRWGRFRDMVKLGLFSGSS